jgi:hypothetical protein
LEFYSCARLAARPAKENNETSAKISDQPLPVAAHFPLSQFIASQLTATLLTPESDLVGRDTARI